MSQRTVRLVTTPSPPREHSSGMANRPLIAPVGLQIVGRHLDDPMVLRASAAFEQAQPWKDRWPALLESLG